ncbi:pelargonidin 3-O-(6-caffeoylglucoside) 5-O-(6-O-malonylglucoside) 4'''-malonyltransferase-like [Iris pallida]|uniref:Pelargonidin 3-O-(6-caffeoylglucoside) 5-O-(6-O-malonylglucoside) 4'''-malonyltransferase-like n=1 Tax=Iris pallida TaxID=29817 RepID=A0AAX6FXF4_IRIPA|nr:pelargonidin 3-O-(6-caffeoylglucoside) 5-O-(6-O-malonylglucoside) 4'''-malonyltransferase-like [Iris pallida]
MSMWKVEVVSHAIIKPSSPTPPHLRTHHLSWLDQASCPHPFKLIFFYSDASVEPAAKALSLLKSSLSETLTLFYPAAGRLNPNDVSIVNCDDQGVELFEARASPDAPLSKLLDRGIDYDDLTHFLPPTGPSQSSPALLSLQVTVFASCGGMSVGGCFSHKLFDAHSAAEFVKAWAYVARDGGGGCSTALVPPPLFDAASRFVPPSPGPLDLPSVDTPKEKIVAKRFVFEEVAIQALRKSPVDQDHPVPSKTVAVTALLWRCCIRAREVQLATAASEEPKRRAAWVALVVVNIRGKAAAEPSLPDNLIGNICGMATATADASKASEKEEKRRMEEDLRSGIRRVDAEMVRRLQGVDGFSVAAEPFNDATGKLVAAGYDDINYFMLSSWSRFPLYEADFGWGRPAWVAPVWTLLKNVVVSMGRGEVGGLEVWVSLEEDMMAEFERDVELISYTRPGFYKPPADPY